MYRQSFLIVILSLLLMGLVFAGGKIIAAIPGVTGLPSSYDPKITVEEAVKTSKKPLLIEFYTDTCKTCKVITPWTHKLSQKYKDQLTFVMVDVSKPESAGVAQIFGIEYVPAIFVFDFKHMSKAQIDFKEGFKSYKHLDREIQRAMDKVEVAARKKAQST